MVRFPIPLPDLHGWKSWAPKGDTTQGIIKRNWVPTGRIDLATHVTGNEDADEPADFKLMVEERRIVESVTGLRRRRLDLVGVLAAGLVVDDVAELVGAVLDLVAMLVDLLLDGVLGPVEERHEGAPSNGSC